MDNSPVGLLTDQFAKLTDPRTDHAKWHKLAYRPEVLDLRRQSQHLCRGAFPRVLTQEVHALQLHSKRVRPHSVMPAGAHRLLRTGCSDSETPLTA